MHEPARAMPLVFGRAGLPNLPLPIDAMVGMLVVTGSAEIREGVTVQHCLCACSRRECGIEADVDVRRLNDPELIASEKCPLYGPAFFPPLDVLLQEVRKLSISDTTSYRQAYAHGRLPKCSPRNPSEYAEWTSWADFLGKESYFSDGELMSGLLALDLESLGLLPRPERRRFLLVSRYWQSLKAKAQELGIAEADIPDRLGEIVDVLEEDQQDDDSLSPKSGTKRKPTSGGTNTVPPRLDLAEEAKTVVNSVTLWLPKEEEMQREILNGFFAHVWEIFDREDTLHQRGFAAVKENVLDALQDAKPELVGEFMRQYHGVTQHRVKGRNWMQAYSLWYANEHRRFINWSDAGLGKTRTVPAIVNAFDIRFTIIFSPKKISNQKNPQLEAELKSEDPLAFLYYSDNGVPVDLCPGKHHYFICNSEKLQLGVKTVALIDALIALNPELVVFDEGHLLVSSNLVEAENAGANITSLNPRMEGLYYLLERMGKDIRTIVLTGTPVRVDAREGQALFELIGQGNDVGSFTSEMNELNALRLRGKLQQWGFKFSNNRLPELRRYIVPFMLPEDVSIRINDSGLSLLQKEKLRMEHALGLLYSLNGRLVINSERVTLPSSEAEVIEDPNTVSDVDFDLSALAQSCLPIVRLRYEPLERSINPVFFSYFVDGITDPIADFLTARKLKYRRCTGDSDDQDLGDYLHFKDSCLIASSSWSVGVDGSQRVSNAIVMLGMPWHDSGHRQTIARLQRQGAVTPSGTPTTVVHEIIPVALNAAYDVKRLNRVYSRRTFTEVLSLGEVDGSDDKAEFEQAVTSLYEAAREH